MTTLMPRVGEMWTSCDRPHGNAWRVERVEPEFVLFRDPDDAEHSVAAGVNTLAEWRLMSPEELASMALRPNQQKFSKLVDAEYLEALEEAIADMKADAGTMRTRLAAALAGLEEANRTIAKLQAELAPVRARARRKEEREWDQ